MAGMTVKTAGTATQTAVSDPYTQVTSSPPSTTLGLKGSGLTISRPPPQQVQVSTTETTEPADPGVVTDDGVPADAYTQVVEATPPPGQSGGGGGGALLAVGLAKLFGIW